MAHRHEMRQRLLTAIAALPEQYREPVMMRYVAGADYEAIGKQLGVTNGSLRGLLARGIEMLKDRMKPQDGRLRE